MMLDPPLRAGDVVRMKKAHACGGDLWEILMAGADVRMKCKGCGRVVLLDRVKFNSRLKKRETEAAVGEEMRAPGSR